MPYLSLKLVDRTGSVDARLTTQLTKVESTLLALTGETA